MAAAILGDIALPIEMTDSKVWIEAGELACRVEAGSNRMLDAMLPSKFVKPDAPVDLSFLANGEVVGVDEDVLDSAEGPVEVCFIVCTSLEDDYSREF